MTSIEATKGDAVPTQESRKRTFAEKDAELMAAYREKFGGDVTATFEDGKASEMGRSVRNNLFRCNSTLYGFIDQVLMAQIFNDIRDVWRCPYTMRHVVYRSITYRLYTRD